jgi:hypothetical protein
MKERLYGRSKGLWIIIWSCRNLPELQGPRNGNEFHQSLTVDNLVLILTELEEHTTCQYRVHDALETKGFCLIVSNDGIINKVYSNVRREEICEGVL